MSISCFDRRPAPWPGVRLAVALLCLASAVPWALAGARADILDMEDKDRATVAKETLRQKRDSRNASGGGKDKGDKGGCGSVDIGNSDNAKGSSRIAEREKTVIVTGNVYNTANCGR